ncbi:ATP-binding protein [Vibrio cholerae]|uniref:ATP-binding protein n=1 Tax=Vibrio cholerae TaxID=666 RepID=UPI000C9C440E|nr:ATP-binding protein [Vibrio cholerae]EGQ7970881.1 ATP-binding protein [Vibrio cholerae]EHP3509434.1 ATP-binding protein [Vibrio cholerae]EJL6604687.1 ATP-binding protein [Vibrio cholerae]EJL6622905.1 ATP-binding protein [Vibrio cholerae]EJL6692058.1 ATP-binding protein [Vibrio cholerae]
MIIDRNWTLQEAFEHINQVYRPGGQLSGPQRNRLVETWGHLVGKSRATKEVDKLVETHGSMSKACKHVQMSPDTMKSLRRFFESLPDDLEILSSTETYEFTEGEKVSFEEDLCHEFKEVKGNNPTKSIQNLVDEYVIAFLNSSGGSIFWGITDQALVKSIKLNTEQKDNIRKAINLKINTIEPAIDPTQVKVAFHNVKDIDDGYVLEIKVPKSNLVGLYFNTSGNTWVRINGCKQKLQGVALQEYILKRVPVGN